MKTQKAKLLNRYLLTAIKVYNDTSMHDSFAAFEIDGVHVRFQDNDFELVYFDFLEELRDMVITTKDIDMVHDYIVVWLNEIINWNGFTIDQYKVIFTAGHQVTYQINLKRNIEKYVARVIDLSKRDNYGEISEELIEFYERTIAGINPVHDPAFMKRHPLIQSIEDVEEKTIQVNRFDIARLKVECEKLPDTVTKINFMQDQLYDYRQMEIESKKNVVLKKILTNSRNFEKLCAIELERLFKRLEMEQKYPIHQTQYIPPIIQLTSEFNYTWQASDADLLELVSALYKAEVIKHKDGKKTSRIELLQVFEKIFGREIKEPLHRLPNDMGMEKYHVNFLDSLIIAFEAYSIEQNENKSRLN